MELTIGKEKVELVEAAKASFQAQHARTVRALAVLMAAANGQLEAAKLEQKGPAGSYLLIDPKKGTVVGLSGLKGHPKPKGVLRGAVVNQRVQQDWAEKQVPVVVLDLLDKAFEQALGALRNGKPHGKGKKKASSSAPEKAVTGKKAAGLSPGKAAPKPGKKVAKKPTGRGYLKDAKGPRPGREK